MEALFDPHILAGLATLIVLEIILGVDNLVFIAILAERLPPHQRDRARVIGLSLAMVMRLLLLTVISWVVGLTRPLISIAGFDLSGRDLILIGGGLFLLFKATTEIHERLEGQTHATEPKGHASFAAVIAQILVLDMVFSLDSVITAVGMVDELWVMMTAVVIAMIVMIIASKPLTAFVAAHPTVVMLCLAFLLMIGLSLVAEGFGVHIPKGYLYAAIAFSIMVEAFNQLRLRNQKRRLATIPLRQRTTDAVLRLLGGQPALAEAGVGGLAPQSAEPSGFAPVERDMVAGVIRLGARTVRAIMTPRAEIGWLDVNAGADELRAVLEEHGHSRYLVADGRLDALEGVIAARDVLPALIDGAPVDLRQHMQPPLLVHDQLPVPRLIERFRESPLRIAVVVDDQGVIDGLVTPTDVLASIAGDLVEAEDAPIRPLALEGGGYRLDGSTPVDEAAALLERPGMVREGDFATFGGFVLHVAGRIPAAGETFDWQGWRFTVEALDGRRVAAVTARPTAEPDPEPGSDSDPEPAAEQG